MKKIIVILFFLFSVIPWFLYKIIDHPLVLNKVGNISGGYSKFVAGLTPVYKSDGLTAAIERPLFNPLRRVPADEPIKPVNTTPLPVVQASAPPPIPTQPVANSYLLIGIMRSNGDKFALIKPRDNQKAFILHQGDMLEQWHITQILPTQIKLENGNSVEILPLSKISERRNILPQQRLMSASPGVALPGQLQNPPSLPFPVKRQP